VGPPRLGNWTTVEDSGAEAPLLRAFIPRPEGRGFYRRLVTRVLMRGSGIDKRVCGSQDSYWISKRPGAESPRFCGLLFHGLKAVASTVASLREASYALISGSRLCESFRVLVRNVSTCARLCALARCVSTAAELLHVGSARPDSAGLLRLGSLHFALAKRGYGRSAGF